MLFKIQIKNMLKKSALKAPIKVDRSAIESLVMEVKNAKLSELYNRL